MMAPSARSPGPARSPTGSVQVGFSPSYAPPPQSPQAAAVGAAGVVPSRNGGSYNSARVNPGQYPQSIGSQQQLQIGGQSPVGATGSASNSWQLGGQPPPQAQPPVQVQQPSIGSQQQLQIGGQSPVGATGSASNSWQLGGQPPPQAQPPVQAQQPSFVPQQQAYAQQQQNPLAQQQQAYGGYAAQSPFSSAGSAAYGMQQQNPSYIPAPAQQAINAKQPDPAPSLNNIPTPSRAAGLARARGLYMNDRQMVPSSHHSHSSHKETPRPRDVASGNTSLEVALQVILNVQKLDKKLLAQAMLSPNDGLGGLDAPSLMQRLAEMGPRLLSSEERLIERVKQLEMQETVALLKDIGLDDQGIQDTLSSHTNLVTLHEDIIEVLKAAHPADTLADAVSAVAERRLRNHLEHRGVTRYSDHIVSLRHDDESWASVWQRIWLEYPSRPIPGPLAAGCEHRSQMRVIIIGPGFGLLATPHMIDLVRRSGYQLLELPELPNLENVKDPYQVQQAVQALQERIWEFQPHVICAASKGGLYLQHLWRDPNFSTSCVLINAHPSITQLPQNAPVVVTQGSRDDTFKRMDERSTILLESEQIRDGVAANVRYCPLRVAGDSPALVVQQSIQVPQIVAGGQIQMKVVPAGAVLKQDVTNYGQSLSDAAHLGFSRLTTIDDLANLKVPASISYRHGREDLEDFARTGNPDKTLLFLSTSGITARPGKQAAFTRKGDGHAAPESLCKDDTLPRLIDAAVSGKPEEALQESWAMRTPEERRAAEAFLGHDPEAFRRLWSGQERLGGLGLRVAVSPESDEFFAVQEIFRSNPADKTYNFGHDWEGKRIQRIERVQAPGQLEAIDTYFLTVQKSLEAQGTCFVGGVHSRWLFHGSRAIDAIVSDPVNGFKTTLSKTTMWGSGSYFARDAQYPDDHGFFGEPRQDGSKDMLLCLVVTGMSVLGDESFAIMPYRHGSNHRYNSLVDSMSNPEIIVVNNSGAVLPAYVITYV